MARVNNSIDSIVKALQRYFGNRAEIEVAYLFGSVAQNRSGPLSDVDIAVLLDEERIDASLYPYGYNAHLLTDLVKLLQTNRVDLVVLNDAPLLLRHRILYGGRLICAKNEDRRIRFHVGTINRINDFKYLNRPHLARAEK